MSEEKKVPTLPHVVKLEFPVKIGSEEIDTVTFERRIKSKDLQGIPDNLPGVDRTIKIASRVTGIFQKVFEEMDICDLRKISEVIECFLPNTQPTGDAV